MKKLLSGNEAIARGAYEARHPGGQWLPGDAQLGNNGKRGRLQGHIRRVVVNEKVAMESGWARRIPDAAPS